MKKFVPYILAIGLFVGAYFLWTIYGTRAISTGVSQIKSLKSAGRSEEVAADWRELDETSHGFKVKMPTDPHPAVAQATTEVGGTEEIQMLVSGVQAGTTYAVAWADNPPVERVNGQVADRTLDMARDGATTHTQTTLITENRISPQGYPGRELVARNVGGGYLETRIVLAGTRLYMLVAASPSVGARRDQDIQRFFNSFTLASDGKLPTTLPPATLQ